MNLEEIKKTVKEHFEQFPVLKVVETPLQDKVEIIYNELPGIYKKLSEAKLLPEGMNFEIFMKVVVSRLQEEAQQAHIQAVFGI